MSSKSNNLETAFGFYLIILTLVGKNKIRHKFNGYR